MLYRYALTNLLTYLLTPWSRVLLEKLTGSQLVKKFTALYGIWKFIIIFTIAHHLSLSWASSIQSIPPHLTSWRSILILSSHLCLGFPSGLSLRFSHQTPVYISPPPYMLPAPITQTILGEQYISLSYPSTSFLHSPVTSSLLGPNILLKILFSNTLSLRASLNASDQVSHPHKITGKINRDMILKVLNWTLVY